MIDIEELKKLAKAAGSYAMQIDPQTVLALIADIDKLKRQLETSRKVGSKMVSQALDYGVEEGMAGARQESERLQAENDALRQELEEARKDAERYQWLRDNWTTMQSVATRSTLKIIARTDKWADFGCEVIDTAIDAARQQTG